MTLFWTTIPCYNFYQVIKIEQKEGKEGRKEGRKKGRKEGNKDRKGGREKGRKKGGDIVTETK